MEKETSKKRKGREAHFCSLIEEDSGLLSQLLFSASPVAHSEETAPPPGKRFFCLTQEEYQYAEKEIHAGKRAFLRPLAPQETPRDAQPPSLRGLSRSSLFSNQEGPGRSERPQASSSPSEEVGGQASGQASGRLFSPPLWLPSGLPPVTFRAFGRELRELEEGSFLLTWETGPLLLAFGGEEFFAGSPLEITFPAPGSYRLEVRDLHYQPASFTFEVRGRPPAFSPAPASPEPKSFSQEPPLLADF